MSYLPWQRSLEKYGSMGIAIPAEIELIGRRRQYHAKPNVTGGGLRGGERDSRLCGKRSGPDKGRRAARKARTATWPCGEEGFY
jgi:hypothetical protein